MIVKGICRDCIGHDHRCEILNVIEIISKEYDIELKLESCGGFTRKKKRKWNKQ